MIDMKKVFGHGLTRQDLEDMASPIMASELTDEQMQRIAVNADSEVKERYPEVADEMFRIWTAESPTEDELDYVAVNCCDAWKSYWETLGRSALNYGGKVTACDLDEDE